MELVLPQLSDIETYASAYGCMTPEEASLYLRSGTIVTRSLAETLTSMYKGEDLVERLVHFWHSAGSTTSDSSLRRKFRNWMNGSNHPASREDLFRIAYALNLSETQLDYLLGLTTDYCIQYRDGRELVLSWFLRMGYSYQDALDFYATLPPYTPKEMNEPGHHTHVTLELSRMLDNVTTCDELHAYYLFNINRFGTRHLRSYHYFSRYLNQLTKPSSMFLDDESNYSIDRIMRKYLSLHVPSTRYRANLTMVQRLIKRGWPNATTIKNVKNRNEDVPRKLLLLLYIVTENCGAVDEPIAPLRRATPLEARVANHWWLLNAILVDCGMAALDPRNAFDWLVLYATSASPDELMSERLEQVIDKLF